MSGRIFDLAGATAGLLVFSPIFAAIWLAVRLEDGAPVLFRQTRLGLKRRPFTILKFRSMRDGRVTRIGRLLRATGLDELPQFVNILRGDMSAVGPRPLTAADVERLGWTTPRHDFRWQRRPGLTGLAQIAGEASSRATLELDRAYLEQCTFRLDCRLIALSFAVNVLGKTRVRTYVSRASLKCPKRLAKEGSPEPAARRRGPQRGSRVGVAVASLRAPERQRACFDVAQHAVSVVERRAWGPARPNNDG